MKLHSLIENLMDFGFYFAHKSAWNCQWKIVLHYFDTRLRRFASNLSILFVAVFFLLFVNSSRSWFGTVVFILYFIAKFNVEFTYFDVCSLCVCFDFSAMILNLLSIANSKIHRVINLKNRLIEIQNRSISRNEEYLSINKSREVSKNRLW